MEGTPVAKSSVSSTPRERNRPPLGRLSPIVGVVFVALWIPFFVLAIGESEAEGDAEIVASYGDEGRSQDLALFYIVVLASLCFIGFLAVLRGRLARAEGRVSPFTTFAFGAGSAAATLWLVAGVLWMAVSYTKSETPEFRVDADTERLVSETAYVFWVTGMFVLIPMVLGTSLLALRTHALPRWLGWLGLPVGVSLLGALGVFPFFLFLGWVLLVSLVLLVREAPAAELAGAAP